MDKNMKTINNTVAYKKKTLFTFHPDILYSHTAQFTHCSSKGLDYIITNTPTQSK